MGATSRKRLTMADAGIALSDNKSAALTASGLMLEPVKNSGP
jgi:hypothetical protein